MEEFLQAVQAWLRTTALSHLMTESRWAWPISESFHFIGVSLLFGIVGLYDLRLIGFLKRIPMSALHRLIPFGVAGYFVNLLSGLTFITGMPDQYVHNPAFHMKVLFMTGAGINVALFYLLTYKLVKHMGAGDVAPFQARIAGAVSLACWTGVIVCGRYLTFFRPPARWCPWC
jgi:hypothetical protein